MVRRSQLSSNGIAHAGALASPLGPALAIAFLASISTGVIDNGLFFIAKEEYGFGRISNSLLALMIGVFYIPSALAIGPVLRGLSARFDAVTPRRALIVLMVLMGGLCSLPVLVRTEATVWIFMALYIPLMGAMWPMIEGYLSGGLRGRALRRATGKFNLLWASAVMASAWLMAPLLHMGRPLAALLGLGLVHLLCIWPAMALPDEPIKAAPDEHEPHPPSYVVGLLKCFRWLLLLSYVLMATLTPMMPWRLDRLELSIGWQMPMLSIWMLSRVAMFWLLQHWGGWHGRWRTPIWSGAALGLGFAGVLLTGSQLGMVLGLALFGIGAGTAYAAGLYYAMEVGDGEVDAGGKHEAVIGAGFTIGPLFVLIAALASQHSASGDTLFFGLLGGMSGALTMVIVAIAVVSAHRAIRSAQASEMEAK
jgi:Major Facilitator Superfamily